jgi:DNA polymerase-3 subunit beta
MPTFKDDKKVVLPQETLKGMMKKTSFAISTDESRYVLNGIYLSLKDHKMTMVATDGRRLALVDEELDVAEKSQGEFIVPAKTVNELNRLLQEKGEVEIHYAENQASFSLKDEKGGSVLIVTKLIEGNYPNYRQVIPAETKERVALVREEFLHALRRAEIMTSEKSNSAGNHGELTRSGRSQGDAGDQLQRHRNGHRFQSEVYHRPAQRSPQRRGFPGVD